MKAIETIFERMRADGDAPAIYWRGSKSSYAQLDDLVGAWKRRFREFGISAGTVCGFVGDYSPQTIALIFALLEQRAILVPFTEAGVHDVAEFCAIAGVQQLIRFDADDGWTRDGFIAAPQNELVQGFRQSARPGLIVFTSGSTGKPKGILHDCERVMSKFVTQRPGWRTVLFLMMDHFGGFNTLLSTFAYGGMGVCLEQRTPESVCRAIAASQATLLPTTPTFLNLLAASRCYQDFDISSVRLITYGTEVMHDATLQTVRQMFPHAELKQTYGLSELGVLRSRSENGNSLWVKVGGEGFEVKIVDSILWVRSEANMVGYLNAPSPFDGEGWMCTGDRVERRGEFIRIIGRESEIINVGGQKVFPAEVESVLLQAGNVADATVFGARHPLMGEVVHARISLLEPEDPVAMGERLRKFCLEHMARHKMPVKFMVVAEADQHSARFKKLRGNAAREETPSPEEVWR